MSDKEIKKRILVMGFNPLKTEETRIIRRRVFSQWLNVHDIKSEDCKVLFTSYYMVENRYEKQQEYVETYIRKSFRHFDKILIFSLTDIAPTVKSAIRSIRLLDRPTDFYITSIDIVRPVSDYLDELIKRYALKDLSNSTRQRSLPEEVKEAFLQIQSKGPFVRASDITEILGISKDAQSHLIKTGGIYRGSESGQPITEGQKAELLNAMAAAERKILSYGITINENPISNNQK